MPLPGVESLLGHIDVELPEQPAESLLNLEFISTIEMYCEAHGCINEVDGSVFDEFVNFDEREMLALMKATYLAFRSHINPLCLTEHPERYTSTLGRFLEVALYLVVRGNVLFLDYPDATFCKPVGPKPTPEQQRRILDRIRADQWLQLRAIKELIEEGNRGNSNGS
jgi:hypothetical protein